MTGWEVDDEEGRRTSFLGEVLMEEDIVMLHTDDRVNDRSDADDFGLSRKSRENAGSMWRSGSLSGCRSSVSPVLQSCSIL
jgi:hypothetical protein